MPQVTFLYDKTTISVEAGTSLQAAVEMAGASLPFGCRKGSCGTCRCVVIEGSENINALTEAERDLFDNLTSVGKNERLGCQITIYGDVKIQS